MTWSTSNSSVISILDDGQIIAVLPGTATLTLTASNGVKGSMTFTVVKADPTVSISGGGTIKVGSVLPLISSSVTGIYNKNLGSGEVKYYSDSACTNEISAPSTVGTYYAKAYYGGDYFYNAAYSSSYVSITIESSGSSSGGSSSGGSSSGGGGGGGSSSGGGGGGGGGGSSSGGGGGGGAASPKTSTTSATYSSFWKDIGNGVWKIYNNNVMVTTAWLCDDAVTSNGQNVWYLLNTDGTMLSAGLVQDNTGNFYSLETTHNGYFGMLRYKNGVYDCNGQKIYLEFSQNHDGTFGAVTNPAGLAALKSIYGVTKFGVDNNSCQYTKTFK